MSENSTQPFDVNENTGEPSNRPEHDEARRAVDEELDDDASEPITPEDTSSPGSPEQPSSGN